MQSVAETPTFTRQAEKLFSEDEKMELISFLSIHPLAGDLIPGTGGVRKRFAASGSEAVRGRSIIIGMKICRSMRCLLIQKRQGGFEP